MMFMRVKRDRKEAQKGTSGMATTNRKQHRHWYAVCIASRPMLNVNIMKFSFALWFQMNYLIVYKRRNITQMKIAEPSTAICITADGAARDVNRNTWGPARQKVLILFKLLSFFFAFFLAKCLANPPGDLSLVPMRLDVKGFNSPCNLRPDLNLIIVKSTEIPQDDETGVRELLSKHRRECSWIEQTWA